MRPPERESEDLTWEYAPGPGVRLYFDSVSKRDPPHPKTPPENSDLNLSVLCFGREIAASLAFCSSVSGGGDERPPDAAFASIFPRRIASICLSFSKSRGATGLAISARRREPTNRVLFLVVAVVVVVVAVVVTL